MSSDIQSSEAKADVQSDLMRAERRHVLKTLLQDKTSKRNILWATDTYAELGPAYSRGSEITPALITGKHSYLIRSRAQKRQEQQSARTKAHAEVFTPLWVCAKMNDAIDEEWFGAPHVFFDEQGRRTDRVEFPQDAESAKSAESAEASESAKGAKDARVAKGAGHVKGAEGRTWRDYVKSRRLEITCGEAPYLVSRYDVATGEPVSVEQRVGILDRKLRVVDENAQDEGEWLRWALRAMESTYGYEFQGDNLLIARLNILATFEESLRRRWHREATDTELRKVANIIAWNIWQMDGLSYRIPFSDTSDDAIDLFEAMGVDDAWGRPKPAERTSRCRVYNWSSNRSQPLVSAEGKATMKFDYIIGNPPYQEGTEGDNKTYAKPIYDCFLDAAYQLGNVVEMIHPARFLFNAGSTPKAWNKKMLNDEHLKVLWYEADSKKVFSNTDIKGGVAVTLHNARAKFGRINQFIPYPELKTAVDKIQASPRFVGLNTIAVSRTAYRLTEKLHSDFPNVAKRLSAGHRYDMSTNILELLPEVFHDSIPDDGQEYIQIVGREGNARVTKYIRREYVNHVKNLDAWKLLMPKASGTGDFGETLADIIVAQPGTGSTETFMSMGNFADEAEATNCLSYVKTRFVRALLGVLKTTQDITPAKWKYVPLQDFTSASDIDWSQSVSDIDKQLYKKYNLTDEEIDFIEKNVKEMK